MKITATCAHCGTTLKSVHLALPVDIRPHAHVVTPTLNNCGKCGARGAYLAEKTEAPWDGR
jgi:hypothetical protein